MKEGRGEKRKKKAAEIKDAVVCMDNNRIPLEAQKIKDGK
jgi:hypothetical protein